MPCSTCSTCSHFGAYPNDPRGRGDCLIFGNVARSHWAVTRDCINNGARPIARPRIIKFPRRRLVPAQVIRRGAIAS